LVGEEGPELVNFTHPGRVYTAAQTRAMLAGADAAPTGGFGDFFSAIGSAVSDAWSSATQWVRGGLAKAVSLVLEPVVAGSRQVLPDEGFTSIARNAALKGIEAAIAGVAGKDAADLASGKAIYTSTPGPWKRPTNG